MSRTRNEAIGNSRSEAAKSVCYKPRASIVNCLCSMYCVVRLLS